MHQRVARALEEQYGARLEEHAAELADHFSYSSDPSDLAKAVAYGEMAARRAMGVYAYGEAAKHLERCLQVQEVLDHANTAKCCDLLLALGEALMSAGEPRRVYEDVAEKAFGLGEALGDRRRSSRACRLAFRSLQRYGAGLLSGQPVFHRWAERADGCAGPGTVDRVEADIALAMVLLSDGRLRDSRAMRLRALDLARQLAEPAAFFRAAQSALGRDAAPRQQEDRRRLAEELLAWPRGGVDVYTLGAALAFCGQLILGSGDRDRAEDTWGQVRALAERTRDPNPELRSLFFDGQMHALAGDLEEAVKVAARLLARGDEIGQLVGARGYALLVALRPLLWLGRANEGGKYLSAVNGAAASEDPRLSAQRALLRAHMGQTGEAAMALKRMVDLVHGPEGEETATDALTLMLETALKLGDREVASELER